MCKTCVQENDETLQTECGRPADMSRDRKAGMEVLLQMHPRFVRLPGLLPFPSLPGRGAGAWLLKKVKERPCDHYLSGFFGCTGG
jgi:hypothetical protein